MLKPIVRSGRAVTAFLAAALALGTVVAACGSKGSSNTFQNNQPGDDGGPNGVPEGSTFGSDGPNNNSADAPIDLDAYFAMDPPPMWCGPDGGAPAPPPPGGTVMCPDDKNRQGCPCPTVGMSAACWPGLRANRDLGQCKDGTTTCVMQGEFDKVWGPCMGYVLPTPGATTGAAACKCFSGGSWTLTNLSPCFEGPDATGTYYAVSTYLMGMTPTCPTEMGAPPFPAPTQSWTTDTLKVDCAGTFTLCFTLKAGNAMMPLATDCTVDQVCTTGDYTMANMVQPFPDLPGWSSSNSACATQFATSGGYGEMSVQGKSVRCDIVDNGMGGPDVFERVQYCPLVNPPPNCSNGGSGMF